MLSLSLAVVSPQSLPGAVGIRPLKPPDNNCTTPDQRLIVREGRRRLGKQQNEKRTFVSVHLANGKLRRENAYALYGREG
jgi:hypothetical protein